MVVNENLELGCSVIEKAATDKAVNEIDERLALAYEVGPAAQPPLDPCAACSLKAS